MLYNFFNQTNRSVFGICVHDSRLLLILCLCTLSSCSKLVEVPSPPYEITDKNVFTRNETAIAVVNGIYSDLNGGNGSRNRFSGVNSLSVICGLSADELELYDGVNPVNQHINFYKNQLVPVEAEEATNFWRTFYNLIFRCNAVIEGIGASESLSSHVQTQLIAEAKFLRGLLFFYLYNLYGDIPLTITTDYKINSNLERSNKTEVYRQVIADISEAKNNLSDGYVDEKMQEYTINAERVRPNKFAAMALLARVYLFNQDWGNAKVMADSIINNTALYFLEGSLQSVFLKNGGEAIWQLQPVIQNRNTDDAITLVIPSTGFSDINDQFGNPVYLNQEFVDNFESDDQRKIIWLDSISLDGTTYYYPFKYKIAEEGLPVEEYVMVLRLAEQYLIRAESRLNLNDLTGALADINAIRRRAGLSEFTSTDSEAIRDEILHQRRYELFMELGHRWFDIKRLGLVDGIMSIVTPTKSGGTAWQTHQQLYPIPLDDLLKSPALKQNLGY